VCAGDNDAAIADIVSIMADDFNLGGRNASNCLSVEWVAEDEDYKVMVSNPLVQ
jgi:hypothetical protein